MPVRIKTLISRLLVLLFAITLTYDTVSVLAKQIVGPSFVSLEGGDIEDENAESEKETEKSKEKEFANNGLNTHQLYYQYSSHWLMLRSVSLDNACAGYKGEVFSPPERI
jgi:hypothetical protein